MATTESRFAGLALEASVRLTVQYNDCEGLAQDLSFYVIMAGMRERPATLGSDRNASLILGVAIDFHEKAEALRLFSRIAEEGMALVVHRDGPRHGHRRSDGGGDVGLRMGTGANEDSSDSRSSGRIRRW
jgi:hypothetical protein